MFVDPVTAAVQVRLSPAPSGTALLQSTATVTAPFAGVITARFVDPGAFIPAATGGSAAECAPPASGRTPPICAAWA